MKQLCVDNEVVCQKNKGFTLIELSIVMVIIGLIIGGILTGQELIHGAGVRATMSQIIKYNSAVNTFQMKYNALPGDFSTATTYIVGAATVINGNGDGLIGSIAGPATPSAAGAIATVISTTTTNNMNLEYGNFWSHLSYVGLIEGSYPPVSATATALSLTSSATGPNFPAAKVNAGIGVFAYGNSGDSTNYYQLGVTAMAASQASITTANFLSPNDAYAIDSKMDDGVPSSGIVVARGSALGVDVAATFTGSATISTSNVTQCVLGTSYAASIGYNTAAATSSSLCQLRVRIN
jgi:prepilin-type N-terminal cleavage/methylation domain-containing protein